jgi:hypothetical protein
MEKRALSPRSLAAGTLALCLATLSPPALAVPRLEPTRVPSVHRLRGSGGWQRGNRATQRWNIDLIRRDDSSIEGRVTLAGSPLLHIGVLRGTLNGRHVSGSVSDDDGNQAATFVGIVRSNGAWEGTYQDRTGEVGRWIWSGPDQ